MNDSSELLRNAVQRIYSNLITAEKQAAPMLTNVHARQKRSAVNLLHYLALRREDLRPLQDELHNAGLSSLASSESHILWQIQAVLGHLGVEISKKDKPIYTPTSGAQMLNRRARSLFGRQRNLNIPHLMVTFETKLASDYAGVKALLNAGMNIARINCAHDTQAEWEAMIANVRKAAKATGHGCKIYLDLAGPKIRTQLLGKGRRKGRLELAEKELFFLAEANARFHKKDKVVGCTLAGVVQDLRPGHRVLFDDGLFQAIVESVHDRVATLRMTRISAAKPRLKPEKGINFPDTPLSVHSLTDYDKSVLPFAQEHADLIGFSFVNSVADLVELQQLLSQGDRKPPIVLKIETLEAVQNLPALLLQGMAEPDFGVMIARGDLAVEIGFERLSEIQEEILWVCEAAHVPVIWATQVLETLNKSGIATRSEISDAMLAGQAECVMLNKGKFLLQVLATLQDILHRSGGHRSKKRYTFRSLKIAERFFRDFPS